MFFHNVAPKRAEIGRLRADIKAAMADLARTKSPEWSWEWSWVAYFWGNLLGQLSAV
jgi:hypothetical protein